MSQNFIIVIDADNSRASAAYQKGLADIERIWPQIESYSKAKDAERNAEYEKKLSVYEAQEKKNHDAYIQYSQDMEAWLSSSSWCRGSPPSRPFNDFCLPPYMPCSIFGKYCSVKADLKHMADVASAAIGPFRMTEHQVDEMVSWEDGSAIDRIKARISGGDK